MGSQARILYSNEEGRASIALAFNKAVSDGRLKVCLVILTDYIIVPFPDHRGNLLVCTTLRVWEWYLMLPPSFLSLTVRTARDRSWAGMRPILHHILS